MKANEQPYEIGELGPLPFGQGNHYEIYKKLGAHEVTTKRKKRSLFCGMGSECENVSVVGEFNDWNLERDRWSEEPLGIYTCLFRSERKGICISSVLRRNPFANYAELRPGTASRITDISNLNWSDSKWMAAREKWDNKEEPVSIYEVHMGSWMRHPGREDEGFYTYREFAEAITKYVKEMGYTICRTDGHCRASF